MSDEFGSMIEDKQENKQLLYRKIKYLKLDEGEHTIRILDSREERSYTHYMGFAYVRCLGDECPICQNNKKILFEHPTDYSSVKGWLPRRDRYYINVMDRTPTKVCEKCKTEAGVNLTLCPACSSPLGQAAPLNEIKVLSGSKDLFADLKVLSNTVRDENDVRIDIRTYDWLVIVRGKGREKAITVSPKYLPNKAGFLDFNQEDLYNLQEALVTLTPSEMLDVANGAALKDIFALRRASKKSQDVEAELSGAVSDEIAAAAESLFNPD